MVAACKASLSAGSNGTALPACRHHAVPIIGSSTFHIVRPGAPNNLRRFSWQRFSLRSQRRRDYPDHASLDIAVDNVEIVEVAVSPKDRVILLATNVPPQHCRSDHLRRSFDRHCKPSKTVVHRPQTIAAIGPSSDHLPRWSDHCRRFVTPGRAMILLFNRCSRPCRRYAYSITHR
jgi:hypothetical protein